MRAFDEYANLLTYSTDYRHYLVQYEGSITNRLEIANGYFLTQINDEYSIISVRSDLIPNDFDTDFIVNFLSTKTDVLKSFKIIYILGPSLYTLLNIQAETTNNPESALINTQVPLNLKGENVIIGILDTGIDYLNEEFIDYNDKTRILGIWDQTIETSTDVNPNIPYGTVYTAEQIQSAIIASKQGKNPYDIVPSKDTNGHGTNMAGIIAATGKTQSFSGIASKCSIYMVKLHEAYSYKKDHNIKVPIYNITSILPAIEYLKNYAINNSIPMVIFMPVGITTGNHKGLGVIDSYLQKVASNIGVIVVTGSGNEGSNDGHASGTIFNQEEFKNINLIVAPEQTSLYINIWVDLPNIMSINIFSPSGEDTGNIIPSINSKIEHQFIFEKTYVYVRYSIPEEFTGEQRIRVFFNNMQPGIWRIRLTLTMGKNANFNAWLPQRGITLAGTRFSPSDPYGTITLPGDSTNVITVAAYNQNNNTILGYSGLSLRDQPQSIIDVTAGGTDILTVGLNKTMTTVNGTGAAAAIVSALCVLLLEWGIIKKHYPYMYTESIRTFLTRGTILQKGDVYPNPRWGYGIIDFYKVFESIT